MPRILPTVLRVYEQSPTSTSVTWELIPNKSHRLGHTTRLPGGFFDLELTLPLTMGEFRQWRNERLLFRAVLEQANTVIWEGRLEGIELVDVGLFRMLFRGYWRTFQDSIDNNATYSRSFNDTGDGIIKDMLDNGFHADAQTPDTSDQTNIDAPGHTAINRDYDADHPDWSLWQILTDSTVGILSFPDSSDRRMQFAVWEDRLVHYNARNPTSVDWTAYLFDPARASFRRFPAFVDTHTLGTAIKAIYESGGSITETAYNTDANQITKYVRIEQAISNMGGVAAANATEKRDQVLNTIKEVQQTVDDMVLTRVFDSNGREQPLCRVRAGDVLQVPDFIPTTSGLGSATLDALRTFVIEETRCDHQSATLIVRPDFQSRALTALLSRANIKDRI